MSRKEYMEQLDMLLRDIPHTERQEALKYYEDYFADAGEEHEAEVIEELGSPEELAKRLREDLKREAGEGAFVLKAVAGTEGAQSQEAASEGSTGNQRMNTGGTDGNTWNENYQEQNYHNRSYQDSGTYEREKPHKGYKTLTVCLIVLGVLIGIGYLGRLTGGITRLVRVIRTEAGYEDISDAEMTTVAYGKNEIRDLDIDTELGILTIECWDGDDISISYPKAYISVEKNGGELLLEAKEHWSFFWRNLLGDWEDHSYQIIMKIPKDLVFGEVNIDTGACSVDIERLEAANMELDTGAGELTADEIIVAEAIDVDAGVGDTAIERLQAGEAQFSVGVGELNISGCVNGDISADCGVGEMTLKLTNKESDFNYNISCGVGEISINGKSYSGIANSHEIDNDAEYDFDMDCGVGEIEVTFGETQAKK